MPRARSASTMRASIVAGNGAYTAARAGKYREAVMHGPVEAEISRSSRISPSIGPTVSWRHETARVLATAAPLDGHHRVAVERAVQRGQHRRRAPSLLSVAAAACDRRPARGLARADPQSGALH